MPMKQTKGRASRAPVEDSEFDAEVAALEAGAMSSRAERFCLGLVEGMTQAAAYEAAGYAPDVGHASRLASNGKIKKRVAELRLPGLRRVLLTHEEHLRELADLRDEARRGDNPAYGAAVSAEIARGKCAGLYTEKVEHSGPDGEPIQINKAANADELFERWTQLHQAKRS